MNGNIWTKIGFRRRMLLLEGIGFFLLLLLLWLNEWMDLPSRVFGTVETPFNWAESTFESAVLLVLAGGILFCSQRMLCHIACLEGVLHICPVCKRIREAGHWIPFERFVERDSCAQFTHGLCPECEAGIHHLEQIARDELAKALHS